MAQAYSYDLRQKVMQAIELDGLKKSEASKLFNISRNTINLWCQRKVETGDVQLKPRCTSSHHQKITDPCGICFAAWEKFHAFAKEHEDKTQVEMAQLWEGNISSCTISRALQKLGLTRKKRRTGITVASLFPFG